MTRIYQGRASDARTGIYREEDDAEVRWYVTKAATAPVVTIDKATGDVTLDDLGRPTTSTTAAFRMAGARRSDYHNGFTCYRDCGALIIWMMLGDAETRGKYRVEPVDGRCRITFKGRP